MTAPDSWHRALADLLSGSHRLPPDELPSAANAVLKKLGVTVTIYLVDAEQSHLRPLPDPDHPLPDPLPIDTSLAGRAFTNLVVHTGHGQPTRLWVPLVDGTERLGLLEVRLSADVDPDDKSVRDGCQLIAGLLGHLITSKSVYGDNLRRAARSQTMAVSAELLWQLLPPLTFASQTTAVSALLEPCYEVGGDAFDYAIDDGMASVAILDGVGHGLPAVLTTSVALAAMRAARRAGEGLFDIADAIDRAIRSQWSDARFVTAVLARFDTDSGLLRYINAGHPPPLVLRHGRTVRVLPGGRRLPLGLPDSRANMGEIRLEPGDRLLMYTDGVTEARNATGAMFEPSHLADLAARHIRSGLPPAEILRRLGKAVAAHQDGPLRDDATLLLVEWSPAYAAGSAP